MEIPAIYSVYRGGEIRAAPVDISGTNISFISEPVPPAYSAEGFDERMSVLVVDVKGLGRKRLDDRLLMNMKFSGSDIWFMTFIKDVEDVFDCFMGNVVKVLMPYHTVRNDIVPREVFEVTENCIPVLFVLNGRVVCREEQTEDIGEAIREMERIGFREIAVLDIDYTLRDDDWASLHERSSGIIPFVRSRDKADRIAGFQNIIIDF